MSDLDDEANVYYMAGGDPVEEEFETERMIVDPIQGNQAYLDYWHSVGEAGQSGVLTGIPELDAIVRGFRPGSINLIAGETSNGKTSLAVTLALSMAKSGVKVVFASLEVPFVELETKIISNLSGLSFRDVEMAGKMDSKNYDEVYRHITMRGILPLATLDFSGMTPSQLERAILNYERRTEIIFVDYIQLMGGDGGPREREVSKLSRGLKDIGRKLKIPIIAVSQLRRIDPRTEDHRPTLERLRDSGQLEQDASIVLGVYWPHRYGEKEYSWGTAEVSILKNRNGPCKALDVPTDWECGRFWCEI